MSDIYLIVIKIFIEIFYSFYQIDVNWYMSQNNKKINCFTASIICSICALKHKVFIGDKMFSLNGQRQWKFNIYYKLSFLF